ncbi:AraC family transcriptional regulator [Hyphococcus flavus]|uniref:AraC family transcriptional regulator n=1 Tax=Hyphococcus flavus TaxID=1866326 RepID=A0AAE9ZBJ2_9PROT|nr:AraC family transcriptional regulator [Hyphococcus flavus]WDI31051.1 AraC family transcriptional regulator [Hyphococcus flavus]
MELRYFLPRADLRQFVRAYYYFSTETPSIQPLCAELGNIRVLLNGGGVLSTPNGENHKISQAFLIGPTLGAYTMAADAGTRVFGVGIRPQGWGMLIGMEADEAADQVIDLSAFAGGRAATHIEAIRCARDFDTMATAADRFFSNLLAMRRRELNSYPQALEKWLMDPNEPGLDALVTAMDVSRRQTDRLAKKFFGASPKFLQRKYRALRAADRVRSGAENWMDAAGQGFYDQSHFIKEFRSFIGVTPKQFITNQAELISEIQMRRRQKQPDFFLGSL